jgi:hypothetical protein
VLTSNFAGEIGSAWLRVEDQCIFLFITIGRASSVIGVPDIGALGLIQDLVE